MTMKAHVCTDSMGNITVHMEGGLDHETGLPFRKELEGLMQQNPTSTITLDMHKVDFVGSSGIGMFVETIQALNDRKDQIRLSNVKTEFMKVFKLFSGDAFESLCMQFDDDETETLNQRFANRRKTFAN